MKKRKKLFGAAAFRLIRTRTHCRTGETSETVLGTFRTNAEAEQNRRQDEEAWSEPEYEFQYRIEVIPTVLLSQK